MEDEGGGTHMPPPPDDDWDSDDAVEAQKQRDAWQVRELIRILETYDKILKEEREAKELEFRRGLSDKEIMLLERNDPNNKRNRFKTEEHQQQKGNHMQRYFHRGAFYLDEDSLKNDPNDVRNRAKEYALAPTGEDKIDKRYVSFFCYISFLLFPFFHGISHFFFIFRFMLLFVRLNHVISETFQK